MDNKQIRQLANLAQININDTMVDGVRGNIENILDLVNQLQSVDTEGVAPMSHPMDAVQRLRQDKVTEADQRDDLQAIAPKVENGLFLVPQVID